MSNIHVNAHISKKTKNKDPLVIFFRTSERKKGLRLPPAGGLPTNTACGTSIRFREFRAGQNRSVRVRRRTRTLNRITSAGTVQDLSQWLHFIRNRGCKSSGNRFLKSSVLTKCTN